MTVSKNAQSVKFGELEPSKWPGERLGLNESGSGSVARIGRRVLALLIDWAIASVLSMLFFSQLGSQASSWITLLLFAVLQIIAIPSFGGSLGHLICGMRVVALNGEWVGLLKPVVRTVLLCLVIPTLVWDSDQRGFHDKVAGTVLIRT